MTRKPPRSAPAVVPQPNNDIVEEVRRYKLITPLFGGGVEPQKADPLTTVRASEIRGHLRFWWRATRGGQFNGELAKMKVAEEKIWGSAATMDRPSPSKVSVVISDVLPGEIRLDTERKGRENKRVEFGDPLSPYSYVAFPLRNGAGVSAGELRFNVEFTLTIRYCSIQADDIAAALWAWETFGGIGARTRRGFGALECIKKNGVEVKQPQIHELQSELQANFAKYVVNNGIWPSDLTYLLREFELSPKEGCATADEAWKHLFNKLKDFRQARFSDGRGNPYGRSKWPEPDAIRNLTGRAASKHVSRKLAFNKFPRAAFGLPIIFQFKDASSGDPEQTSLEGLSHDRLASPLVLRPLACANNKYVGLAAVLYAPHQPPGGIRLKGAPDNPPVESDLTPSEAKAIDHLNGNRDVLVAFLRTLRRCD